MHSHPPLLEAYSTSASLSKSDHTLHISSSSIIPNTSLGHTVPLPPVPVASTCSVLTPPIPGPASAPLRSAALADSSIPSAFSSSTAAYEKVSSPMCSSRELVLFLWVANCEPVPPWTWTFWSLWFLTLTPRITEVDITRAGQIPLLSTHHTLLPLHIQFHPIDTVYMMKHRRFKCKMMIVHIVLFMNVIKRLFMLQ